jgi:hypothetical protein
MKAFLAYKNPPVGEGNEFHPFVILAESFADAASVCGGKYEKDARTGWNEVHFPAGLFRALNDGEKKDTLETHEKLLATPWYGDIARAAVGTVEDVAAKIEALRVYEKGPLRLVLWEDRQEKIVLYLRELPVLQG